MARYPAASWKRLRENDSEPRISATQVILHSAVDHPGPTSLFGFFNRRDVYVESHFFIKLDGSIEQYMDTDLQADANRKANARAISIETEDDGNPDTRPWTPAQVDSILALLDWAHEVHGIPRQVCPDWRSPGIGFHSQWGAPSPWTPARGKTCPGRVRIRQFWDVIVPRFISTPPPIPNSDPLEAFTMFAEIIKAIYRVRNGESFDVSKESPGAFIWHVCETWKATDPEGYARGHGYLKPWVADKVGPVDLPEPGR